MGLVYGRQLPPANQLGNVLTLRHNVFYYKKSKQSSHHLNKCEKFRSTMMALDPHERPTWFAVSTKRQKKAKALSSMKAPTGISFGHPSAAPVKTLQESMRRYALPKLSQVDLEAIKKYFAMHFYITSTLFHRVGQFHLKRAFQRARPDIVLPNRQALANKYLDICYHEVKQEKDRRLGAPDTQDIFGPRKTKWGGNDVPRYPNGYSFEHLANFVDSCKDVVRFIRNNGRLKSSLSSLQKANHLEELKSKKKTVAEFWMLDDQAWPLLRELALRVFNLVASSAASERNFSMHGFIQSKKRNRLSPSTVTKLMYIKTNYNLDDEVGGKDYSSDEYTNSE
ncbi:hypothetical protein B5M09_008362 [Aphanomyces astaci]|uniref:HAT C-terminal dimerisation domain-containing protein n=1 Tax=Aphanomyces astaci TaxID=112090 RepID=A0A425DHY6_APHAT|nr:hypothetical protein B5M09_008362 [Aphanomyces astaci]